MSYLSELMSPLASNLSVSDERAWSSWSGAMSSAGLHVTAETALKLSAVWACTGLIAESVAMLPLIVYRYLSNGGRERATNHPLYTILHDQPNEQQTAFEFRDMMSGHALLRGNAYAQIVPGPRGFADQLVPLHPDRVRVEALPDGSVRYKVRQPDHTEKTFNDEDILHIRGRSLDGKVGLSVVAYARESFGTSLARQDYAGNFYRNDSRPGGVLKTKGKLSPEGQTRLKTSWESAHASGNAHRVAVLEEGLEWQAVGMHNKDAQFIESEEFGAEDICRWFRVPPHMVGLTSKATSWGSGIEEMGIGFVTYTLMPWLTRWQQAITRDLILAPQSYFAEFLVDALLRGDTKTRFDAYAIARNWGWMSVNDIRRRENENPIDGGDAYLQPMNMTTVGTAAFLAPPPAQNAHYRQLVSETAARIVRKEIAAMQRAAKKAGNDGAWIEAVNDFYADHAAFVAQTLRIDLERAGRYAAEQSAELIERGPAAMDDWETRRTADLAALVLGEKDNGL